MDKVCAAVTAAVFVLIMSAGGDAFAQSFWDRFNANQEAISENYSAPEALSGDLAQTGLLLIDGDFSWAGGTSSVDGVALTRTDNPALRITSGSFNYGFPPRSSSTAAFNLEPGDYRVQRVRFTSAREIRVIDVPELPEFVVDIRAGEVAYLGRIRASQRMFTTTINFVVTHDEEREREAWRRVLAKYSGSPWTPLIEAHVNALGSAVPAHPASSQHQEPSPAAP